MRVGFIGLGSMGGDQATLIAGGGFDFVVYDAWPAAGKRFEGRAELAASPAGVGRGAAIVGVCVRDDQQVREVLLGDDGLLSTLAAGALVLIHSTVSPATIIALAAEARTRGIDLIDAAVTRSQHGQPGPFVVTMTGGDAALTERARPVLQTFSTDIIHCGELGAGMGLKITNNFIAWSHIVTFRQALNLARAGGVDIDKLKTVLEQNGNLTKVTGAILGPIIARNGRPFTAEESTFFASQGKIGEKDLDLAIAFARGAGVPLPTAQHGREQIFEWMTLA